MPNLSHFLANPPGKLFLGRAQGGRAARANDIHYRFGLREIHFAVEKRPFCELPGFRSSGAGPQDRLEQT